MTDRQHSEHVPSTVLLLTIFHCSMQQVLAKSSPELVSEVWLQQTFLSGQTIDAAVLPASVGL